jgi:divalent metal cation (Fe/Co/Zn/Cd) transporter
VEAIGKTIVDEAAVEGIVSNIHNVRVRETDRGLVVNYHARVDGGLGVSEAHRAVDRIERALRAKRADVCRVVTHAEPLKDKAD